MSRDLPTDKRIKDFLLVTDNLQEDIVTYKERLDDVNESDSILVKELINKLEELETENRKVLRILEAYSSYYSNSERVKKEITSRTCKDQGLIKGLRLEIKDLRAHLHKLLVKQGK